MSEQPRHATPQPISWLTPQFRAWLYGIVTAIVPILTIYGIIDQNAAPLWLALAASVLGSATAFAHTPLSDQ